MELNRVRSRRGPLLLVGLILGLSAFAVTNATSALEAPVGLGTTESFAVLAGSAVTNTGPTVIRGSLGACPTPAISGFPPGTVLDGTVHAADAVCLQAQSDLGIAYDDAAGRAPTTTYPGVQDLGGLTLTPGVYKATAFAITGTLTLDAQGDPNAVWIFQAGSTLITATDSRVVLVNGAQPCNVFWQVGSSATLGVGSTFVGTILALTSITANTNATVQGRLLARNGAVTLDSNTVTRPVCAPTPTTTSSTTSSTSTSTTTVPATTTSSTAVPPVTVPPVTLPPVTVPPVTVPPVTVPPVTLAPITVPPVTVPPITVPPVTLAPITVPPVTLAPTTLPPVTVPPVTVPPVTLPPDVPLPPISVPPVTVPPVDLPDGTLPSTTTTTSTALPTTTTTSLPPALQTTTTAGQGGSTGVVDTGGPATTSSTTTPAADTTGGSNTTTTSAAVTAGGGGETSATTAAGGGAAGAASTGTLVRTGFSILGAPLWAGVALAVGGGMVLLARQTTPVRRRRKFQRY